MQQQLQDLDINTLQSIFINASKEFTQATKNGTNIKELTIMYEGIKEIYNTLRLKKFAATPVLSQPV